MKVFLVYFLVINPFLSWYMLCVLYPYVIKPKVPLMVGLRKWIEKRGFLNKREEQDEEEDDA